MFSLICSLVAFICLFLWFCWEINLFKLKHDNVEEGELYVSGKGHANIIIHCKRLPKFVFVRFADLDHHHPCHPCNHHIDSLEWEVCREDRFKYKFSIHFDVSEMRHITYKIDY